MIGAYILAALGAARGENEVDQACCLDGTIVSHCETDANSYPLQILHHNATSHIRMHTSSLAIARDQTGRAFTG